jgi:hypothetical protein
MPPRQARGPPLYPTVVAAVGKAAVASLLGHPVCESGTLSHVYGPEEGVIASGGH